ncbi:MAG TPA: alpha-galactosidase [Candidatus Hydrogenedentes bacterium]|nr:alpha-galactosidase [Candidatus Hydrogenedentota bacterium]
MGITTALIVVLLGMPDRVPLAAFVEIGGLLHDAGFEVGNAFPDMVAETGFRVIAASQEYAQPTPNACCHTLTPLRIGRVDFAHGIGAHANGRITLELNQSYSLFKTQAGIDNNSDTQGMRGSAVFIVEVDGVERYRSGVCRGGEEPVAVEVPLTGAKRLDLVLNDAGDGITCDQADWAEAVLVKEDGGSVPLSQGFRIPLFSQFPTSFEYDGKDAREFLPQWPHQDSPLEERADSIRLSRTWSEPGTGFEARLNIRVWRTPPSLELQWEFHNGGSKPSPIINGVNSLDLHIPARDGQVSLYSCTGGLTGHLDGKPERTGFEVCKTTLGTKELTVTGGRSSQGDMPFYYLTGLPGAWGLGLALGWSGQWRAEGRFDSAHGEAMFRAGMEPVHFRLPEGEHVALFTALFVPFQGEFMGGVNLMRRTLREHYQARIGGEKFVAPVSYNSWFVFDNRVNEGMLKELASEAAPLGIEYFCLDSGWFDGDFPEGVGNWTIHKGKFPQGLKPVADHVHALGMKFGLWFEPERVANNTRWQKEHRDWLLGDNLLDLGRPEARALVLEMMSGFISEIGVDWIRFDFNIDPLPGWTQGEGEDSRGLVQIRYINGLYTLLEELMQRFPNLLIEQCSGGGRRIDLRTIHYGHTYWKSDDTYDQPLMRFHETGGNQFILGSHLNTNYCRWGGEGELIALCSGTLGFGIDFRKLSSKEKGSIAQIVAAYKQIRPLLNEDYYPLFEQTKQEQTWCGWQFLNPETGEGCFIVYRPEHSPYSHASVRLQALPADRNYEVQEIIHGEQSNISSETLSNGFDIALEPDSACIYFFK